MTFSRRWAGTLLGLLLMLAGSAPAQMLYLDDLPFFAVSDSTSRLALQTDFNRFEDAHSGWSVNRLLVTMVLPAGQRGTFFLRMPYTSFDTGTTPLFSRWPWVRGNGDQDNWPPSARETSLSQPEIGATGPLALSFLHHWHYAIALGLPAGSDRLYPFGSVSIPFRLGVRRVVPWGAQRQVGLTFDILRGMDSGKDLLRGEEAFPGGIHLGAVLNWYRHRGSRFSMAYDYHRRQGRRSQLLGVQAWTPWTESGAVGLKVARELQGTLDRPAAWYFTLSFRLDSLRFLPGAESEQH